MVGRTENVGFALHANEIKKDLQTLKYNNSSKQSYLFIKDFTTLSSSKLHNINIS